MKIAAGDPYAQAYFDRVSELRKSVAKPENLGLYDRRACPFAELPEEAKARFEFVTTYDGETSFIFEEKEIFLPKAFRRKDAREFSQTHITAMRDALRQHCTILRAKNSPLAEDVARWGDPEAILEYQQFYADRTSLRKPRASKN